MDENNKLETTFDKLDLDRDYIEIANLVIETRNKFVRRAEIKPMAIIRKEEDGHATSRAQHLRQVANIAKEIAKQLGLNEKIVYIGMLLHDAGHAFYGHEGEFAVDMVGRLLNVGHYHHAAKGIDVILSEDIIGKIIEKLVPDIDKNKELKEQLEKDAWYFLDLVVSHDGESVLKPDSEIVISLPTLNGKIKDRFSKDYDIKEAVLAKVKLAANSESFKCRGETLESQISKPSDVIAYIKTDLIDAFSQGITTKLSDDFLELMGQLLVENDEYFEEFKRNRAKCETTMQQEELDSVIRKKRIEIANKYIDNIKKKELRELVDDIDEDIFEKTENVLKNATNKRS